MSKLLRPPTTLTVLLSILTLSFMPQVNLARYTAAESTRDSFLLARVLSATRTPRRTSNYGVGSRFIWDAEHAAVRFANQERGRADLQPLPLEETIKRQLGPADAHVYVIDLKVGESLRVDLVEKGIDCKLSVSLPSGERTFEAEFGDGFDRETITFLPERGGIHKITVEGRDDVRSGSYTLTGAVSPASKPGERLRARAVQSLANAQSWIDARDSDSILEAIQKLEDTLQLWRELREDYWAGYTANILGVLYFESGQIEKCIEHLDHWLAVFQKSGDKGNQIKAASRLGQTYGQVGRSTDALKLLSTVLALRTELQDEPGITGTLLAIGVVHAMSGAPQSALEYFKRGLTIAQNFKDVTTRVRALVLVGAAYGRIGDVAKASKYLQQALETAKQIHHVNFMAGVLDEAAEFFRQVGKIRQALEYRRQSLSLYQKAGNRAGQAEAYFRIGEIYESLGELRDAQANFQNALKIYEKLRDNRRAALTFTGLAGVYRNTGDLEKARECLRSARALIKGKEQETLHLQAELLLEEAREAHTSGDDEAALRTYREVLDISRTINDRISQISALLGLVNFYYEKGDADSAFETALEALIFAKLFGDPEMEAWAFSSLMSSSVLFQNFPLAIFYGKEAINKLQGIRKEIRSFDPETQKAFARQNANTFLNLAYLLLRVGRYAEAVQVINVTQDQHYYDFIGDSAVPPKQITLTAREAAFSLKHQQVSDRAVALFRQAETLGRAVGVQPSSEQTQQISALSEQADKLDDELSVVLQQGATDLSRPSREGEETSSVEDLAEMQSTLSRLSAATGQNTVAVYVIEGAGALATMLITPDSVRVGSIVASDDIGESIQEYYARLRSPAYDPRPLGKKLYDLILKPMEPALQEAKAQTLLWSLGGTLRYVPMASLWDGEHYLVERYQSVVFTRANKERMIRADSPTWFGVGFGTSQKQSVHLAGSAIDFPGLPGVSKELGAIFNSGTNDGMLKGEVFINRKFTRESFLSIAKHHYALVHVASHFSFRPGDDTQSFLVLGDGTALTLNEMKQQPRLFEGVELLTLSACDTAALRPDAMGREVDGFAESAQRLGAGAVMATLWTVSDDSTPLLVREFYQARQNGGSLTKAHALQQAQLALLNGNSGGRARKRGAEIAYLKREYAPPFKVDAKKPFAHPYYWAPFILIGNGR